MDDRDPRCLSEALALAARGWPVFPLHHAIDGACSCVKADCTSIGKHPRTKNGLKNATSDENRIRSWFRKWPAANVGTLTGESSGIVVIDVDPRHGGTESLAALAQEYGHLPPTVESLTGGGGCHLIFAHPRSAVGNRSNVRPGIDVRADGGYIVAPPSVHATGNRYRWRDACGPHEIQLAPLPGWLLKLIQQPASTGKQEPRAVAPTLARDDRMARCLQAILRIRTADHKDGSKRLFAVACRCVEFDLLDTEAVECIRAYHSARPFPKSWSDDDLLARIRDAEKRVERGKLLRGCGARTNSIPRSFGDGTYQVTDTGTIWMKETKDGAVAVPLMNFSSKIIAEELRDDGVEQRLAFEIETKRKGQVQTFVIQATRFAAMNWATENLGAGAILYPGFGTKDHARCAIQMLSGDIPRRTVYAHLGWREFDGQWAYLHGGGAITSQTPVRAAVDLPAALQRYVLPDLLEGDDLRAAVRASMAVLDVAPDVITVPVWLAVWRSVLVAADFSIFACGQTGSGKSELAALVQQHFGAGLDARHLPASWSSTGNSLEALAFAAKDALLVVDDFAPSGTTADIARFHRDADRLLRGQGNQSGRARLTSDAQLRQSKPPRGLILSTGEDVPRGHSVRARALIVEMPPSGMDWTRLTVCQRAASNGVYAAALTAFVRWIATHRTQILAERNTHIASLRSKTQSHTTHKRTPSIIAELAWAAALFDQFVTEIGVLAKPGTAAGGLLDRCWAALLEAAQLQSDHHTAADPVRRFQELLTSAVTSGRAHVASTDGGAPDNASAWGWRERITGNHRFEQLEWQPQGDRIGWVDGDDLLLNADAAYRAAQQMTAGDGLPVQPRTLWKRMHERGLLRQTDLPHLKIQKTVEGTRRRVLSLETAYLAPEVGQLGHVGARPTECRSKRPLLPHFRAPLRTSARD